MSNWKKLKGNLDKKKEYKRKRQEEDQDNRKRLKRSDNTFQRNSQKGKHGLHRPNGELTAVLAEDMEFVGVGHNQKDHLARASVVNYHGEVVYDVYVKPNVKVTDFRYSITGISQKHIRKGISLETCQEKLKELFADRIVVGHNIYHDLKVAQLELPEKQIRDTSYYPGLCPKRPISLKKLAEEHLEMKIQTGSHDSVIDAQVCLELYKQHRDVWEKNPKITKSNKKSFEIVAKKNKRLQNKRAARKKSKKDFKKQAKQERRNIKKKKKERDMDAFADED